MSRLTPIAVPEVLYPRAADAGATIFPCFPTLYNHPEGSKEMARQFAYCVLAHIGLPQPGAYVWKAKE